MSKQTEIKTLEQGRAEEAFNAVQKVLELDNQALADKYKSYSKNLPMMIKTNGLGATMAFVASKSDDKSSSPEKKAYYQLYQHIQTRLVNSGWLVSGRDMVEYIISIDSFEYRAITIEVMSYLSWLRRFTEGQIKKSSSTNSTSQTPENNGEEG